MSADFSFSKTVPSDNTPFDKGWGCKWDALEPIIEDVDNGIKITYITPWNYPYKWIRKVAKLYPNLKYTLYWADEDYPSSGEISIYDDVLDEKYYKHGDPDAITFVNRYFRFLADRQLEE